MQQDSTATTTGGQVTAFPCLPLSDGTLEDAASCVRIRARSDALGFDCTAGNIHALARQAVTLATSGTGDVSIPRWQFEHLYCEYMDAVIGAVQRRGRR